MFFFFGLQHVFRQQAHGAHFPQLPRQLLLANEYVGSPGGAQHIMKVGVSVSKS